ncbi:molybdopterin-binding protein [Pseudaestuariivita atlantica]|uniref:Molybdopterin molybdenumtransferase n=1 Tax=Pseudaestuariivita atlantica TaxID=1317121 RepID=A0A0L1JQV2_9RHOB|nr:molybdopterin-binding protein [Pseudaestuariivita atlantica]KNG94092.1 molybdopterin biosynthesis protein MoeA [Pseudaestuariivita atlantica]
MTFDRIAMVDWSGGNDTGPTPRPDAIWIGTPEGPPDYLRNRQLAEDRLAGLIDDALTAGDTLCLGFDFPFGYPAGFAAALTGTADPFAVWHWLADRIEDAPKANNRFDVAASINASMPGQGPFWANALKRDIPHLPRLKPASIAFPERRVAEAQTSGAFTLWQLAGAGAVGSQALMGLPVLARLRARFPDRIAVWPFDPLDRPVTFLEIWPSLLNDAVRRAMRVEGGVKDAVQVTTVARALAGLSAPDLSRLLDVTAPEEGWIFGLGHEDVLADAARPRAPRLTNDCFALPRGVDWLPVADALAHLRNAMRPVTAVTDEPLATAGGRRLATDITALRANPPAANSAVDGYGFAGPAADGPHRLPLLPGRAAAGAPFGGTVPPGHALRILTGALVPDGVDTVILDEDSSVSGGEIAFRGPLKRGANVRKAGEDVTSGAPILAQGLRLRPPDLALAAATGHARLPVHAPLRVAVLSTGDEVTDPAPDAPPSRTFDANRPMLLDLIARWGMTPVDLGRVPDDPAALTRALDRATTEADAILTSGGASAGDEDHVSALLGAQGTRHHWRIALKPGRPLALGQWGHLPVFGLPGNPVAALVCTLVFARPALSVMAGGPWLDPTRLTLPASFTKSKKPGRTEYLRARLTDAGVETFPSEGSGRISGLSWATGLVELGPDAATITPGTPVTYLPFADLMS